MSDRIVGIDLGTSNTVCAYVDELDQVRVVADADGQTVCPSVVSFHPNGGVVVGLAGKQRKVLDPKHTIYSAKRMIGQPFRSHAVQETARRVPFEVKEGPNELAMVVTRAGELAIPEISAIVLDHVRKVASTSLQQDLARAVVTVPASFTDVQRQSTAAAGALAGLTVVRVLNEPTAAALAYGSTKRLNEIIAVYDWGGGTFDITILQLQDQVYTVLGTSGDAFLGGEDMDERLVDAMVATFLKEHRIDLRENDVAMMRLRAVAEHTKIELSRRSRAMVKVDEIAHGPNGVPLTLEAKLTRDEFVQGIGDLIERTFASCKEAMVLAGIQANKIADVVLVGGTTRIPYVRDHVAKFFGVQPRTDMNPEDAIATGAAIQAASIEQMLARVPKRPLPSVPIPVDDLIAEAMAEPVEVEPERAPSKIAEIKRPKRGTDMFSGKDPAPKPRLADPTKTAARAKEFFGDLFGDKPVPAVTVPPKPALRSGLPPKPDAASKPALPSILPPKPAMPTPPPKSIVIPAREKPVEPPPALSMPSIEIEPGPFIDLDPIEDEFSEKSGELLITVEPSISQPLPSSDDLVEDDLVEDSGEILVSVETSIAQPLPEPEPELEPEPAPAPSVFEWDAPAGWEANEPIALDESAPARPLELEEPTRAEPSPEIDLVMPPPAKRPVPELDWQEPAPAAAPVPVAPLPRATTRVPASIVDVTPRSLGIGTVAGFCEELIRRNAQLPAAVKRQFATSRDGQDSVRIIICQGESRRLENNIPLGELELVNLPRRRRGETVIEVEFRIDASGILHVSARDVATGNEQRAKLDLVGGMAPETMSAAADRLQKLTGG
jgi:molecular chaperone DnaK